MYRNPTTLHLTFLPGNLFQSHTLYLGDRCSIFAETKTDGRVQPMHRAVQNTIGGGTAFDSFSSFLPICRVAETR